VDTGDQAISRQLVVGGVARSAHEKGIAILGKDNRRDSREGSSLRRGGLGTIVTSSVDLRRRGGDDARSRGRDWGGVLQHSLLTFKGGGYGLPLGRTWESRRGGEGLEGGQQSRRRALHAGRWQSRLGIHLAGRRVHGRRGFKGTIRNVAEVESSTRVSIHNRVEDAAARRAVGRTKVSGHQRSDKERIT
jgi:hypothetical protein